MQLKQFDDTRLFLETPHLKLTEHPFESVLNMLHFYVMAPFKFRRVRVRVVKKLDLKSSGVMPRRFESCRARFVFPFYFPKDLDSPEKTSPAPIRCCLLFIGSFIVHVGSFSLRLLPFSRRSSSSNNNKGARMLSNS
jgi:hypothetical protein